MISELRGEQWKSKVREKNSEIETKGIRQRVPVEARPTPVGLCPTNLFGFLRMFFLGPEILRQQSLRAPGPPH